MTRNEKAENRVLAHAYGVSPAADKENPKWFVQANGAKNHKIKVFEQHLYHYRVWRNVRDETGQAVPNKFKESIHVCKSAHFEGQKLLWEQKGEGYNIDILHTPVHLGSGVAKVAEAAGKSEQEIQAILAKLGQDHNDTADAPEEGPAKTYKEVFGKAPRSNMSEATMLAQIAEFEELDAQLANLGHEPYAGTGKSIKELQALLND